MAVAYGTRINDDTNFITTIDLDEETCETTGYIDGEAVDFSGGGGDSDFTNAKITISDDYGGNNVLIYSVVQDISSEFELSPNTVPLVSSYLELETSGDGDEVDVILYKGHAVFSGPIPQSISGNITLIATIEEIAGVYDVTGDCTIHYGDIS